MINFHFLTASCLNRSVNLLYYMVFIPKKFAALRVLQLVLVFLLKNLRQISVPLL